MFTLFKTLYLNRFWKCEKAKTLKKLLVLCIDIIRSQADGIMRAIEIQDKVNKIKAIAHKEADKETCWRQEK